MVELEREVGGKVRTGLAAIILERDRIIDAPVEQVYAALSDPQGLGRLLPRVTRLRMQKTGENRANLTTWMQFPVVGEVRTEGELTWQELKEVVYSSKSTLPVTARWVLTPEGQRTRLSGTLDLNLVPLLGPMAMFVPEQSVKDVMARELEKALNAIEAEVQRKKD